MKDEIKEINIKIPGQILDYVDTKEHLLELYNYITNLQKLQQAKDKLQNDYQEAVDKITNLQEENENLIEEINNIIRIEITKKELQEENERLKKLLNCKEYFSATMPKDTEYVILTKNNYDGLQKDIQLDLIDYKSRCEKAIEYIKENCIKSDKWEDLGFCNFVPTGKISYNSLSVKKVKELLNILQGD